MLSDADLVLVRSSRRRTEASHRKVQVAPSQKSPPQRFVRLSHLSTLTYSSLFSSTDDDAVETMSKSTILILCKGSMAKLMRCASTWVGIRLGFVVHCSSRVICAVGESSEAESLIYEILQPIFFVGLLDDVRSPAGKRVTPTTSPISSWVERHWRIKFHSFAPTKMSNASNQVEDGAVSSEVSQLAEVSFPCSPPRV